MLILVFIPLYIFYFISFLFIQMALRKIYREEIKNDYDWFNFWVKNNWNIKRVLLYEIFFLDLFTCHRCGKLKTYKGKYCDDCKDEIVKEKI